LLAHFETLAGTDAPEPFVLPMLAHKNHGGRMGLSRSFLGLMRKAGVAAEDIKGNKRSFHSFRHGFTSRLANAGIAPELRMRLTGHQSAAIHQGYTHLELETLRGAVGKLASLTT
jgi:integrase